MPPSRTIFRSVGQFPTFLGHLAQNFFKKGHFSGKLENRVIFRYLCTFRAKKRLRQSDFSLILLRLKSLFLRPFFGAVEAENNARNHGTAWPMAWAV